jgi:hypothetical protein
MVMLKPMMAAARLALIAGAWGVVTVAMAAEGAPKGPNSDPAKRAMSPRTEAVAQAALADQVARHADRGKDVLAMIAAARLMGQVPPRSVKHEMRTEGKPKAVDGKGGAGPSRDTTLAGLLARAKQYAGGRNDLNGIVDEVTKGVKKREDGPARVVSRIGDGVTDVYTITFNANEPAMVAITGEGVSDLDLSIEDQNGARICSSDGPGDDEVCRWTPRWTGAFRIRVRNLGSVFNEYRLWSN